MDAPLAVALNGYGPPRGDGRREVLPWHDLLGIAAAAEEAGYEAIFTPEIGAREAFSTLAGFAGVTRRIHLATGVAPLGSRDERRMAMEAATLADLAPGRAILGLGSQLPIAETGRRVALIRSLLAGDDPSSRDPAAPAALDLLAPDVPIYLAALGPRMTTLAGAVADGVILNWCTPERVAQARDQVARGADGRDPAGVTVAAFVRACVGGGEERARAVLAEAASQYAAMPAYRRQFEAMGLGAEAARAAGGDADALAEAVCVRGPGAEARRRLSAYGEAGADLVVVYPVPLFDAAPSILETVTAVAPGRGR